MSERVREGATSVPGARAANRVLGGGEASIAIARVALLRLVRGRALWAVLGLALLPIVSAVVLQAVHAEGSWPGLVELWAFLLVILPPVLLAGAIGEEIEERTAAYLWSRPLPRWSILIGKLVGLVPTLWVALAISLLVPLVAFHGGDGDLGRAAAAVVLGTAAASAVTAGIATLTPRWGTIVSIAYLLMIDRQLAWFDASISRISVSYNALCLAGVHAGQSAIAAAIWLVALSGAWTAVAVWRIRRME